MTTVKMEIRCIGVGMHFRFPAANILTWCSIAVHRAFYVSLLNICCLRQCLIVVALKNLAVQFTTSITEKISAKRACYFHLILCEIPTDRGPLQFHPFNLILITRTFQLHAFTLRLVSGK